ncbi:MAG: BON domain-containing protein [Azoarcus sp.]|jgi:osmotically-inducible protein OsmY|nr:BON domain-containing protein [Azoarcus sp.]
MNVPMLSGCRALLLGTLLAAGVPLLQGCFPIVAAGIGAGAVMIADRRTSGTYIDDESIELKAASLVHQHFGGINHINITSYNRNVLLTGEVQNEDVRERVQRLVGGMINVRAVVNELNIGSPSQMSARGNDVLITSNIKTRFVGNGSFAANHIKIVTEAGTVFLLGLVTRAEGDAAAEIARTSKGVSKVVKVFEYISEGDARTLDNGGGGGGDRDGPA